VPFVPSAHVVAEPGELILDHLAGRLGIVVTAALAGAADNKTGRLPASSATVARRVWAIFLMRIVVLSLFLL